MRLITYLTEAAYENNLGFSEMVEFYQKADKTEIAKMERIIQDDDWEAFKELIWDVTGTKLK